MTAPFRVVVVGAGPAGMAAAAVAAECGSQVTLLDENPAPGGQLWRGYNAAAAPSSPHGAEYARWFTRLKSSGAEVLPESSVVDSPGPNMLRIERGGHWQDVVFDRLIIATGARERFLPFPGWTLPGVTGVGGLQALVKSGLPVVGKRVVIAGSGPLLLAVASSLTRAGARVEGIFEQATWTRLALFAATLAALSGKLVEGARYRLQTRAVPYKAGWWVKLALGHERLKAVIATDGKSEREIPCDYLACAFHLVPNIELAQLLACRIEAAYVAVNAVQETSQTGVFCAGEPTGVGGLDKALVEGEIAGLAASGHLGKAAQLLPLRQKLIRFAHHLDIAFAPRAELRELATADTIVCRCEDVTRAEIAACATGRAAKLHTRCGMGPCQGRICSPATEFLFGLSVAGPRPPLYPARIATLAGDRPDNAPAIRGAVP
jgi:NADPH-dependent 2,4-dienoyl-CoA reductase/sulfur reductase-like enzyme